MGEEINWLKETAKENDINLDWVDKKHKELENKKTLLGKVDFALFSII